jgi:uncharacterized protein (TIGR02594 family)
MSRLSAVLAALLVSGCTTTISQFFGFTAPAQPQPPAVLVAQSWVGMDERNHQQELKSFLGIDPLRIEWCAAFVNSVLWEAGIDPTGSLLARSYLSWGTTTDYPMPGDIMVFSRGTQGWQGHVGFYVDTATVDGRDYWIVLGGNQSNAVTYELFPVDSSRLLDIRTQHTVEYAVSISTKNWKQQGVALHLMD